MNDIKYDILANELEKQGLNVNEIRNNLKNQHIETP